MVIQAYKLMSVAGLLEARPHAAGALEALVLVAGELLGATSSASAVTTGLEPSHPNTSKPNSLNIKPRILAISTFVF